MGPDTTVYRPIQTCHNHPSGNQKPLEIFENVHEERGIGTLLEGVSKRYGPGSIGLGNGGIKRGPDWSMKRDMLSPRYTMHWDEQPLVKATVLRVESGGDGNQKSAP